MAFWADLSDGELRRALIFDAHLSEEAAVLAVAGRDTDIGAAFITALLEDD